MSFAGGPLNSYVLHAVATMVDVLRAEPGSKGLVNAISGMITKQGMSAWSTEPPDHFTFADVSADAERATKVVEGEPDYAGEAVIEGATVAYDRDGPSLAVVVATTPAGTRAVASSADRGLAAQLADRFATQTPVGEPIKLAGPEIVANTI